MAIECLVLGAGQEVGKSCVVVSMNGKRIMFDCGMDMAYHDHRRHPDFSRLSRSGDFDTALTCIVITHFHLDHIGALPYFTEVCGYRGPIYMTYPTKALAPAMLEDYRKVMVERRGEEEQFTSEHIVECMKKVIAVDLKQTVQVDKDLQIRAYYAGHVLGASMFYAKVGDTGIVYTGDYNMTPDRHLGAAQIDRLQLDLLITEDTRDGDRPPGITVGNPKGYVVGSPISYSRSTYATTIRDSKYSREREFLKAVHNCVAGGGKVLIPTFALGRAQELCILLEDYWERMNLKVPIYFSSGLTMQANTYYQMLISWTSQKVKETYSTRNAFDFKHVTWGFGEDLHWATLGLRSELFTEIKKPVSCHGICIDNDVLNFDRSMIAAPGPCVLFATPGWISGGFSLEVFKQWSPSEMNLVTLPGYCAAGTIGHKLMSGKPTKIDLDKDTQLDVRCQIHQLSFSPHTDAKGIMDLIKFLSPKHVILVHGERPKMATLKGRIYSELGIQCDDPANNETVCIPSTHYVKAGASNTFIRSSLNPNFKFLNCSSEDESDSCLKGIQCDDPANNETACIPSTHNVKAGASNTFIRSSLNPNYKFLKCSSEGESDSCLKDRKFMPRLQVTDERTVEGILVEEKSKKAKVVHQDELLLMLGEEKHEVQFAYCCPINFGNLEESRSKDLTSSNNVHCSWLRMLYIKLSDELSGGNVQDLGEHIQVESVHVSICQKDRCPYRIIDSPQNKSEAVFFCCTWSVADEKLAWKIISILENFNFGTY